MNPPSEEQFAQIEQEIAHYLPLLITATDTILDEGVSKYPIIVFSKETVELGIPLYEQNSIHLRASTLEEFFVKQLIAPNQLDYFKGVYKQPKKHICIFAVLPSGGNFCFLKRK